jgi:hypothetical protein
VNRSAGSKGGTLSVPLISQGYSGDQPWSTVGIGNTTVGKEGCLLTSFLMVDSYYNGTNVTKATFQQIAGSKLIDDNGNLNLEGAAANAGMTTIGYGQVSSYQSILGRIAADIRSGCPVIVGGVGPEWGHFAVVTGVTGSGTSLSDFLVNDPGNQSRKTLADFAKDYGTPGNTYTMRKN